MGECSKFPKSWTFETPILKLVVRPLNSHNFKLKWSIAFRQTENKEAIVTVSPLFRILRLTFYGPSVSSQALYHWATALPQTHFRPMEFSIKLRKIKSGLSGVHIQGSQDPFYLSKQCRHWWNAASCSISSGSSLSAWVKFKIFKIMNFPNFDLNTCSMPIKYSQFQV